MQHPASDRVHRARERSAGQHLRLGAALANDLVLLSEALDDPGADLGGTLAQLAGDARAAVSSYAGVTVVLGCGGDALRFTVLDDPLAAEAVCTSIALPLLEPAAPDALVILYATSPGAFVDLAADVVWLTARAPGSRLDEHVEVARLPDNAGAVLAESMMNQALGALLARGWPPQRAREELERRAARGAVTLHEAAVGVLAELPVRAP